MKISQNCEVKIGIFTQAGDENCDYHQNVKIEFISGLVMMIAIFPTRNRLQNSPLFYLKRNDNFLP